MTLANKFRSRSTAILFLLCALLTIVSTSGCVKMASNIIYLIKGNDAPAEFNGLQDKKVAVVVTNASGMNSDASALILSRQLQTLLATKVKKIHVVSQEEVERAINDQFSNNSNLIGIGRTVGADYLVAVDVQNLKLHEGKTLYRGRCDATMAVYKVSEGDLPVFSKQFPDFVYPEVGAPVLDLDDARFQRAYLAVLAERIGRSFYPYDPGIDVAKDATILGLGSPR